MSEILWERQAERVGAAAAAASYLSFAGRFMCGPIQIIHCQLHPTTFLFGFRFV